MQDLDKRIFWWKLNYMQEALNLSIHLFTEMNIIKFFQINSDVWKRLQVWRSVGNQDPSCTGYWPTTFLGVQAHFSPSIVWLKSFKIPRKIVFPPFHKSQILKKSIFTKQKTLTLFLMGGADLPPPFAKSRIP